MLWNKELSTAGLPDPLLDAAGKFRPVVSVPFPAAGYKQYTGSCFSLNGKSGQIMILPLVQANRSVFRSRNNAAGPLVVFPLLALMSTGQEG